MSIFEERFLSFHQPLFSTFQIESILKEQIRTNRFLIQLSDNFLSLQKNKSD